MNFFKQLQRTHMKKFTQKVWKASILFKKKSLFIVRKINREDKMFVPDTGKYLFKNINNGFFVKKNRIF